MKLYGIYVAIISVHNLIVRIQVQINRHSLKGMKNMKKSKKLYIKYYLFKAKVSILLRNMTKNNDFSFIDRLKWSDRGFLIDSCQLYNFKKNDYEYYISDYEREKTHFINRENSIIPNNKIIFDSMIKEYIKTPRIYSVILEGDLHPYTANPNIDNVEKLINQIEVEGKLILKPYIGTGGGRGVYVCEWTNNNIFINHERVNKNEFKKIISELHKYIVTEYINQHNYAFELFPGSVNTIRILILEDPQTKRKFMPIAVHRIGTKRTKTVDNWSKGGLSALIDIDKGILGKATCKSSNNKIVWYSQHPDTNKQIEGVKIPNWDLIKNQILSISNYMSFLKYIAWDIVVTKEGFSVIEANNTTDVDVLQVHKPMLADERLRRFYKYYKVI